MVDEKALWIKYRNNSTQENRNLLALNYLPLVKRIAAKIYTTIQGKVEFEELLNYGIFGLLTSIERFEESRNLKFETFATHRIRGAILDGLRQIDPLKRGTRSKVKKIDRAINELKSSLGKDPSDKDVADYLNITKEELLNWYAEIDALSTFQSDFSDSEKSYIDLSMAIEKLEEREKQVIDLYYYEDLSLDEIAKILNISVSRVSQIHGKALIKLKSQLEGDA
ncbi:RNA polymerase, sigma 28 subunit, FliA/WhiG [Thermodesulfobium narugense DSM 14796]|uniref:RNA polymerase, sigma 28 subunit, FliA/WhiG n=1 Tax=Thermodesulfobium narugense DSM 14796 TaxID=747365 RepID=M1E419_9BACT|nr:sigma-70 family RNA polymerase sigma factor [Thermodesulfobium narugense]AEE13662.1 RNA polymerase, sigma 28 subunit, FliA/WhiG [Thermodesulfobium narugense DSM 14796]